MLMKSTKGTKKAESAGKGSAPNTERLHVQNPPDEDFAANLDNKKVTNPSDGFGQLWERTYRVRLDGCTLSAAEVMANWKRNFPRYQPEENRFMPTEGGVTPGAIIYIGASLVPAAAVATEIKSGVLVVAADDVSFTVKTPQGFPVSGHNTFSILEEKGKLIAQIRSVERTNDPLYEFGYRFLGGARQQKKIWRYVLRALAESHGVQAKVKTKRRLIDSHVQWRNIGNVWQNVAIRTLLRKVTAPFRWVWGLTIPKKRARVKDIAPDGPSSAAVT
jgi:hypothetical protein